MMIRPWSNTLLLTTLLIIKLVCIQYALDLIQNVIYLAVAIGCQVRNLSTSRTNLERCQGEIPTMQPAAVQGSSIGCGGCRYL